MRMIDYKTGVIIERETNNLIANKRRIFDALKQKCPDPYESRDTVIKEIYGALLLINGTIAELQGLLRREKE